MKKVARSAIKSIDVAAAPEKIYDFLSNPTLNHPSRPGLTDLRLTTAYCGQLEIKIDGVKNLGVFDHIWKDPQATWKVYGRVVPNDEGSTVMMTLFQPAVMNDAQFDHAMKEMDIEMTKLKEIMEA